MIRIEKWLETFLQQLQQAFGDRVEFVGLQGSYARGEATENSDIDVVVIFDELTAADIVRYNDLLDGLPHRRLVCGFIAGRAELDNWEPSDLFQFYFDTRPLKGDIGYLLGLLDDEAIARAVRIGACNIYHACVHNMLHEKSPELLKGLYKAAGFVVQAIHYQKTGQYISRQTELLAVLDEPESAIIRTNLALKGGADVDLDKMSVQLFEWSKGIITGK